MERWIYRERDGKTYPDIESVQAVIGPATYALAPFRLLSVPESVEYERAQDFRTAAEQVIDGIKTQNKAMYKLGVNGLAILLGETKSIL